MTTDVTTKWVYNFGAGHNEGELEITRAQVDRVAKAVFAGLPWQSVHNGERYAHEPLRLSVCIEAPRAAMTEILKRHAGVRARFDNRWLHLFALDESGRTAWSHAGDLQWTAMSAASFPAVPLKMAV